MKRLIIAVLLTVCLWPVSARGVSFSASFGAAGPFHISNNQGVSPQQFDFAITTQLIDLTLAGMHVDISRITLTGTGISNSNFAVFDVEVHLSGTTIGLPSGQFTGTTTNPDTGIARNAESQLRVVPFRNAPFDPQLDANVNLNFMVDFVAPSSVATSPPLFSTKQLPDLSLDLTDGLHAQIFLWTGSPFTDVSFRDLSLVVQGDATPIVSEPVPEPATLTLLTWALAGWGVMSWRRHRRRQVPSAGP